eukprot:286699-Pelagomonas_calceolata.AAC.4
MHEAKCVKSLAQCLQDRRKFGPLGWNIRYDFTDGDLNVSLAQMKEYLDLYDEIPFKVLRFLITEINYGGRVTDDKDRRLMNNLVTNFVGPDVLQPGYKCEYRIQTNELNIYHKYTRGPGVTG